MTINTHNDVDVIPHNQDLQITHKAEDDLDATTTCNQGQTVYKGACLIVS